MEAWVTMTRAPRGFQLRTCAGQGQKVPLSSETGNIAEALPNYHVSYEPRQAHQGFPASGEPTSLFGVRDKKGLPYRTNARHYRTAPRSCSCTFNSGLTPFLKQTGPKSPEDWGMKRDAESLNATTAVGVEQLSSTDLLQHELSSEGYTHTRSQGP
ncbi:unnamed protein product [Leuciscus chuanchicus]